MNWTREKPTKAGCYWYREDSSAPPEVCQLVTIPQETLWIHWHGETAGDYLSDVDGEWAGPLEPPA